MLKVVQANRQEGKTRHAVEWMLAGKWIEVRPFWSRVIVVPDEGQRRVVIHEIEKVRQWPLSDLSAIRSAIWSWEEFRMSRGYAWDRLEFCVDNFDMILARMFSPASKWPSFITSSEEFQQVVLARKNNAPDRD